MMDFARTADGTRGSALYCDSTGDKREGLEELFRMKIENGATGGKVQEIDYRDGAFSARWRDTRPIPQDEDFFENIWRTYRENRNVY